MKRIFLLTIIVLSVIGVHAQVKSFEIAASKVYDNNTRTSYLVLSVDIDEEYAQMIVKELESNEGIQKFSFYDSSDLTKCMFTSDKSVTEAMIVDMINDVFYQNSVETPTLEGEFLKTYYENGQYMAGFKLTGIVNDDIKKEIYEGFYNTGIFTNIIIQDNLYCELYSASPIEFDFVSGIIRALGVEIAGESIK